MRKSIAVDLDSTLNDLETTWVNKYNVLCDDNKKPSDMTSWDIRSWVKHDCVEKAHNILLEPYFFRTLGVKEGAQKGIEFLSQHYDIYVVTAYHPSTCEDKSWWINRHFPTINPRHIIFCNPKYMINADFLIDDGWHNIESFKQTGLLFDMPHNRHVDYKYRMYDWEDIVQFFAVMQEWEWGAGRG